MTRPPRLIALATLVVVFPVAPSTPVASADPNVLVIVTDDQRLDGTMAVMPKTRSWFQNGGTFFSEALTTTPLCCPSRASIFTGQYAHNHQVKTNSDAFRLGTTESAAGQRTTLQYYLKQRGYQTAIFGKYLNVWDLRTSDGDPADRPPFFDKYSIYDDNQSHSTFSVLEQGIEKTIAQYETSYLAGQAINFLNGAAKGTRPWFLYLAPTIPHSPFEPESKYATASIPAFSPTPAYYEQDTTDKPVWARRTQIVDEDEVQLHRRGQLRMLISVDDMVGTVMQRLTDLREADDTIAFFVSDNGYLWGEHALISKSPPYRESVRVPLFMRWPRGNVAGGRTDTRLAAPIDMAKTVLTALGISPNPAMDGQSLLGSARRNRLLTEWFEQHPDHVPTWASIHTPSFIYTEYFTLTGGPVTEYLDFLKTDPSRLDDRTVALREYYDLTRDPLQLTNLLRDGDPLNDPPTADLSAVLAGDRTCSGASCPPGAGAPALPADTRITSKPDDPTGSTRVTFTFTSSTPNSRFECKQSDASVFDSVPYASCLSPTTYAVARGQRKFAVRAVDPSGIVDATPATYSWQVDTTQPETFITAKPRLISLSRAAVFDFRGRFGSQSTSRDFECKLDGGKFSRCTGPMTFSGLADRDHTFSVRTRTVRDVDPVPASYTWYIDASPPETTITSAPSNPSTSTTASFSFQVTQLTRRVECSLDAGGWAAHCGSPKTYTGLSAGNHTFRVRAIDLVGNVDPTPASHTWTVAGVPQSTALPIAPTEMTTPFTDAFEIPSANRNRLKRNYRLRVQQIDESPP